MPSQRSKDGYQRVPRGIRLKFKDGQKEIKSPKLTDLGRNTPLVQDLWRDFLVCCDEISPAVPPAILRSGLFKVDHIEATVQGSAALNSEIRVDHRPGVSTNFRILWLSLRINLRLALRCRNAMKLAGDRVCH